MTKKDFWPNASIAVIGAGSWGTCVAQLAAPHCRDVRLWLRDDEAARSINATRIHSRYLPEMKLHSQIIASSDPSRVFEGGVRLVFWVLPSAATREAARKFSSFFQGDEIVIHATKGIEQKSMKRISEVLLEELPVRRIGVLSGPNLAHEISRGEPAATVVASNFEEVIEAGSALLTSPLFRAYPSPDVIGVEWAGTLKNILAIASGALDALKLGWNARAMLITRGLAEMVRFGKALGADVETFLSLAGVGDLLATCGSSQSRNYRVGFQIAQGQRLEQVLATLGSTAEGVRTTEIVWEYAEAHGIPMPITQGVHRMLRGEQPASEVLKQLMVSDMIVEG